MTDYTQCGLIPREPMRTLTPDDPRLDPVAVVDALERKIGVPVQVARAESVCLLFDDGLDEPPD
jgi:hypothetical protein